MILSVLLLALLIGGAYSFISLSTANTWLRHTDEVRVGIAQLRGTVLDAETGLRADGRLGSVRIVIITSAPYRAPAGLPVFQKPLDLDKVIGEVQRLC